MGSGLVDLHLKSTLAGEFTVSTISRFWLPLGEESARPQMSKYQDHMVDTHSGLKPF